MRRLNPQILSQQGPPLVVSAVESGHTHPRCVGSEGKGRLVGDCVDHLDIGIVVTGASRIRSSTICAGLFHKNCGRFAQGGRYLNHGFRIRRAGTSSSVGVTLQVMVSVIGEGGMGGMDETIMSGGFVGMGRRRNRFSPHTRGKVFA